MDANTERVLPVPTPDINTFLDTLKTSRTKGRAKDKATLSRLEDLKTNPDLKQERKELEDGVFDRIGSLHPKLSSGINQEDSCGNIAVRKEKKGYSSFCQRTAGILSGNYKRIPSAYRLL